MKRLLYIIFSICLMLSLSFQAFAADWSVLVGDKTLTVLDQYGKPFPFADINVQGGSFPGGLITSETDGNGIMALPGDIYGTPLTDEKFSGTYDVLVVGGGVHELIPQSLTINGGVFTASASSGSAAAPNDSGAAEGSAAATTAPQDSDSTSSPDILASVSPDGRRLSLLKNGEPVDGKVHLFGGSFPGGLLSTETFGTGGISLPGDIYGTPITDSGFNGTYSARITSGGVVSVVPDIVSLENGLFKAPDGGAAAPSPTPAPSASPEPATSPKPEPTPTAAPESTESSEGTSSGAGDGSSSDTSSANESSSSVSAESSAEGSSSKAAEGWQDSPKAEGSLSSESSASSEPQGEKQPDSQPTEKPQGEEPGTPPQDGLPDTPPTEERPKPDIFDTIASTLVIGLGFAGVCVTSAWMFKMKEDEPITKHIK